MNAEEYEKLKSFMALYDDWYVEGSWKKPENHPLKVMQEIENKYSLSQAKRGLQMAINDIVEDTSGWRPERVAQADVRLAEAGTYTLSEVRRRYSKKYLQILKRGTIRNETEYYLLKGILDGGGIEPGATEADQIQAMLIAFEQKTLSATKCRGRT